MTDKEIEKLADRVRYLGRKYWIDHKPEVSDVDFDKLVEELRQADPDNPALTEFVEDESPTGKKVSHDIKNPMLSLGKVFTAEEIVKWAEGNGAFKPGPNSGLVVTYKIDGCSCSLIYEDGKLVRGATRGNGKVGDDITPNVMMVESIPHTIPSKRKIEIRGEIYMTRQSFRDAIARFEKALAAGKATEDDRPSNARNYCAGGIKQKDPQATKERKLSFLAHGCIVYDTVSVATESKLFEVVAKLGFDVPHPSVVTDAKGVAAAIEEIGKGRGKFAYDTDGVVFGLNDLALHKSLGATSHHPRYKIAFKFGRDQGETEIVGVNWNTSRNGRVVPQIEMKPISLGGATVTFCTGHNAKNIKTLGLSAGDKVLMEREVIPYLVKKTATGKGGDKPDLPEKCPTCGALVEWDESETHLICPNIGGCHAQVRAYFEHYVSRKVVNMMGVGDEIVGELLDAGLVSTPADLFNLDEGSILSLGGHGDDSAKKIIGAIQERKEQSLATFLYGLGIHLLGNTMSEKLADKFGTIEAVMAATETDLLGMDKVGDTLAKAVVSGLKRRKGLVEEFLKVVTIKKNIKVQGSLTGKTFCLTGHVEVDHGGKHYDARPDIEGIIKAAGGGIKSVSKGLSFLVAGEGSGEKLDKAKKLGVPVIDGAALGKML